MKTIKKERFTKILNSFDNLKKDIETKEKSFEISKVILSLQKPLKDVLLGLENRNK